METNIENSTLMHYIYSLNHILNDTFIYIFTCLFSVCVCMCRSEDRQLSGVGSFIPHCEPLGLNSGH